jgi:hypothetical protein
VPAFPLDLIHFSFLHFLLPHLSLIAPTPCGHWSSDLSSTSSRLCPIILISSLQSYPLPSRLPFFPSSLLLGPIALQSIVGFL